MKLGPFNIQLARKSAPNTNEAGTSGKGIGVSLFNGEVINTAGKLKPEDYTKMLDTDGTASALYRVITQPILSANFNIEPADDSPEAKKQADFVKTAITRPPHEGGMTTPFELVLADMLLAVAQGWRGFEKVFELKEGKIVYRKIAQRDTSNTTILSDDRGGFNGLRQRALIGSKFETVTIPKEYSFVFTFGKERNWLYGESAFKAAYYHFDKKHRLYYLAHQQGQFDAIPAKVVIGKENAKQETLEEVVDDVDRLGVSSTVGIPAGYTLEGLDGKKGRDLVPLIDHHNAEMARSVLAHFMMLGTGSDTGSWALSSDQSDLFLTAIKGLMKLVESHITSYLLPDLHDYNFENPRYSRFEFEDITDQTAELLREVAKSVFQSKPEGIPDYVIEGIVEKLATHLDIDIPKNEADRKKKDIPTKKEPSEQSRGQRHFLADSRGWRRDLTPAEDKVNFNSIQNKLDTLESEFVEAVRPVFDEVRDDALIKVEKILINERYEDADKIKLINAEQYQSAIRESMLDGYNFAKVNAADELGKKAPATSSTSKQIIAEQAVAIQEKQYGDLKFEIQKIINNARRTGQLSRTELSIGEVISRIRDSFIGFFDSKIAITAGISSAIAINLGRDDVFNRYSNDITRYQYSAILDARTCPICSDLDGKVVTESEYATTLWKPPIHGYCRCIWVAILTDEEEQPDFTGLPSEPGGTTEPLLSVLH